MSSATGPASRRSPTRVDLPLPTDGLEDVVATKLKMEARTIKDTAFPSEPYAPATDNMQVRVPWYKRFRRKIQMTPIWGRVRSVIRYVDRRSRAG